MIELRDVLGRAHLASRLARQRSGGYNANARHDRSVGECLILGGDGQASAQGEVQVSGVVTGQGVAQGQVKELGRVGGCRVDVERQPGQNGQQLAWLSSSQPLTTELSSTKDIKPGPRVPAL